jgi:hypothetical protein
MSRLKLGLALSGFLLALLSVALDEKRLAWVAIGLLGASFLLRVWLRRREGPKSRAKDPL